MIVFLLSYVVFLSSNTQSHSDGNGWSLHKSDDSFGKLTASTGSLVNPFRYTARESDSETGLYYYRARYYDPGPGRFLSEDPSSFLSGGINFYGYFENSPLGVKDPNGWQAQPSTACT